MSSQVLKEWAVIFFVCTALSWLVFRAADKRDKTLARPEERDKKDEQ